MRNQRLHTPLSACIAAPPQYTPGMIVAAIANRTVRKAVQAYEDVGIEAERIRDVSTAAELSEAIAAGCVARAPTPPVLFPPIPAHVLVTSWPARAQGSWRVCNHHPPGRVSGH